MLVEVRRRKPSQNIIDWEREDPKGCNLTLWGFIFLGSFLHYVNDSFSPGLIFLGTLNPVDVLEFC